MEGWKVQQLGENCLYMCISIKLGKDCIVYMYFSIPLGKRYTNIYKLYYYIQAALHTKQSSVQYGCVEK